MRWLCLLVALGACGKEVSSSAETHSVRQQPSVTQPGLHIGGYVNVGVVREF